jgi:F-type H+-transporting ATPase subunit delta
MAASKVAIRYASSFLDSSIEKNILDKVSKDFEFVHDTLSKNKELIRFIKSPVVKNETKQSVLSEIFQSKIDKESLQYLLFVATKGRENILIEILEKFFEIRDEHLRIARINVTTSFEFTQEQKNQIEQQFEKLLNKKVYMTYSDDNNLVGGFVARVGDTIYDASIIHQLELLKKQFLLGNISLN